MIGQDKSNWQGNKGIDLSDLKTVLEVAADRRSGRVVVADF